MHISQKTIQAMRAIQRQNQHKPIECLDVLDGKNSKALSNSGNEIRCMMISSPDEIDKVMLIMEKAHNGEHYKATHNHNTKLRLSPDDILQACGFNFKEMQNTTTDGKVHIMELRKKINPEEIMSIYSKYSTELIKIFEDAAKKTGLNISEYLSKSILNEDLSEYVTKVFNTEEYYKKTVPIARKFQKLSARKFGVKFRTVLLK